MKPQRLPTVRAWCAQRPAIIAALAVMIADVARQANRLLRVVERAKGETLLPMQRDLPLWLSCYRHHRRVAAALEAAGTSDPQFARGSEQFHSFIAELQGFPNDIEDLRHPQVEACGQRLLQAYLDFDVAQATPYAAGEPTSVQFASIWFHVSVTVPCLLLFSTHPTRLLQRARHGDRMALGQLLMLDRNVLFDPCIQRLVHADPQGWKHAMADMSKRPRPIRTPTWKVMAAASIRYLSCGCKHPIAHRDIADLFHACARDIDGDKDDADIAALGFRSFERMVTDTLRRRRALFQPAVTD